MLVGDEANEKKTIAYGNKSLLSFNFPARSPNKMSTCISLSVSSYSEKLYVSKLFIAFSFVYQYDK